MLRRARPLLGTLVEIGAPAGHDAAFEAIAELQARLSRFEPGSDIGRFNALPTGGELRVGALCAAALAAARQLRDDSEGLFDATLGSGPEAWRLEGEWLHKLAPGVTLDLGGIAKGQAVDLAVQALRESGVPAGWVNAGGDLRVFGDLDVPIMLRDERDGGTREFARLRDGAFATSHYAPASHSALRPAFGQPQHIHVSVAAPLCLWADALTKVVALSGQTGHPLLARYHAAAWQHEAPQGPS